MTTTTQTITGDYAYKQCSLREGNNIQHISMGTASSRHQPEGNLSQCPLGPMRLSQAGEKNKDIFSIHLLYSPGAIKCPAQSHSLNLFALHLT